MQIYISWTTPHISLPVSWQPSLFCLLMPHIEELCLVALVLLFLEQSPSCSPYWQRHFVLLEQCTRALLSQQPCQYLLSFFLNNSHLLKCEVIIYCGFDLQLQKKCDNRLSRVYAEKFIFKFRRGKHFLLR